jgi:hypothetical protein
MLCQSCFAAATSAMLWGGGVDAVPELQAALAASEA